jgi:hypothetical protein
MRTTPLSPRPTPTIRIGQVLLHGPERTLFAEKGRGDALLITRQSKTAARVTGISPFSCVETSHFRHRRRSWGWNGHPSLAVRIICSLAPTPAAAAPPVSIRRTTSPTCSPALLTTRRGASPKCCSGTGRPRLPSWRHERSRPSSEGCSGRHRATDLAPRRGARRHDA